MHVWPAKIRFGLGAAVGAVIALGAVEALAQPRSVPVEVATVVSRNLQEEVFFIATLEPDISTTAGAVVAGRIIRSDVREGDHVQSGRTVLIQLDRTAREIALRQAEASVARAQEKWDELRKGYRSEEVAQRRAEVKEFEALLARAEQDFRRAQQLHRNELISLADFQGFQSGYLAAREKRERARAALRLAEAGPRKEEIAQAEAELREARARYDLIAYELEQTTLRAPLTGSLVRKYVDVGTWVNPGDPVADLIDLDPIFANGPVGERKISFLRRGLPADVTVDAFPGQSFTGTVAHIIPRADPKSRTFPVKVQLANPDGRLKSGMLARVTVKTEGGRVGLLVPKEAIVRRGAAEVVFVVENGLARQYEVLTGPPVGGLTEVRHEALKAGLEVVVLGNESLSDGTEISKANYHKKTSKSHETY